MIAVSSPDPRYFDEVLFLVREEYMRTPDSSPQELLRQAERAAADYAAGFAPERTSPYTYIRRLISFLSLRIMRFSRRLM